MPRGTSVFIQLRSGIFRLIGLRIRYSRGPETKSAPAVKLAASPGYSLIELLVVLTIIGLIVGLAGPRLLTYLETSKVKSARMQIGNFSQSLDLFFVDTGRFPTSAEGLAALVQKPSAAGWAGPYLKTDKVPADPWGHSYNYRSPGEHGRYDLYSYGADGREGGAGNDADITSWGSTAAASAGGAR
jgi:general secretion pathway protein G